MVTASELRRNIDPGSTEFGDRGPLEEGMSAIASATNPAGAAPGGGPQGGAVPGPTPAGQDPLAAMLGGGIASRGLPITDGLSMGPGETPSAEAPLPSALEQRLKLIMENATSPYVREIASRALRRHNRSKRLVGNG